MNPWQYLEETELYTKENPEWNKTLGYITMLPYVPTRFRPYAVYRGEQSDGQGGKFPLWDIIDPSGQHPRHKSTLSSRTMIWLGLNDLEKRI